ncbi:hypothetical protein NDI76_17465 [Halogeometricum sp. S1BR25-6]|uniref:UbiD operon protein n=1 Tax=Halogeometricum salsisoli TaxID=2950536 RepID=A0ABU2GIB8_9EURY|nr:hypothetical protein [Halogeometricum sp. S1BR25-6]MDS0300541.1 hypothetical protein [Halogeometricum sp. S1BR25-6]
MARTYTTSEEYLPEDTEGEVTLQVTDTESREIFRTRARVSRDPDDLSEAVPLTVVKGPHENRQEQWYIDFIETDVGEGDVDEDLLRECLREAREGSDLMNARSEELRAMLQYLVRTGEYDSLSDAVRSLLSAQLSREYPELVEEYVDLRTALERESVEATFRGEER